MADLTIQKRRSGTISGAERITGVKNAQAEMILSRRLQQYQNNYRKSKLNIALEEYRLENDARLLSLDGKTNDLDYKRRLYPDSDLSHEEMSVKNLQKYLVRNSGNQCYLDKKVGNAIRNRADPEYIPAVVAKARKVLRSNELMKEMEEARKRMYSFMRDDHYQPYDNTFLTDADDEEMTATKENQVMFPRIPARTMRQDVPQRPKTIHEKLRENPVVRVAFENHRKQKELEEEERVAASPTLIISRMSKKKPLTKTDMMEEVAKVQESVDEFNKKVEEQIWEYKEEEFQQGLKFVKDKDKEWEKFVEKMNKRNRAATATEAERPTATATSRLERRPITSFAPRKQLSEGQKKRLLMKNVLKDVEVQGEKTNALPKRKGLPYHTAERMSRHSTSAKLQRMIESRKAATAEASAAAPTGPLAGPESAK